MNTRSIIVFFAILVMAVPSVAKGQLKPVSVLSNGFKIAIQQPHWVLNDNGTADLVFNFQIENPDGSSVKYTTPTDAVTPVRIGGWTEDDFDCVMNHIGTVSAGPNGHDWLATVPGINPHSKVAHLEFFVRDPNATALQCPSMSEIMRFDDIPYPAADDTTVKLNDSYTTPWGAVLTFTGVTASTKSFFNRPVLRYDFNLNFAKVPDDDLRFQSIKAYDGDVPIDGFASSVIGYTTTNGYLAPFTNPMPPGSHKSIRLDFQISESAESPSLSVAWMPTDIELPLASLPLPTNSARPDTVTSTTINNVRYLFLVNSPEGNWLHRYQIWTQCADANTVCAVSGTAWSKQTGPIDLTATSVENHLYLHADGTLSKPGEYGVSLNTRSFKPNFPIGITCTRVVHKQHIFSLLNVPLPKSGQSLFINRNVTDASGYELTIRRIKWVDQSGDADATVHANRIKLEFVCASPNNTVSSLELLSARDSHNFSLGAFVSGTDPSVSNPITEEPNRRTFIVQTSIPPHGSTFLDLKVIVTEEIPSGAPIHLSIDSDGNVMQ